MRFSLRRLLIYTALIAFAIWFIRNADFGFTQVEAGTSLPSVDWLPNEASNVSYCRSYLNTAYEFDINETAFRDWSRWELSEIAEPVQISRYLASSKPSPQEPPNSTLKQLNAINVAMAERGATVRDGLYYAYVQDNGGGIWVGYDRQSGRAYYQSAPI